MIRHESRSATAGERSSGDTHLARQLLFMESESTCRVLPLCLGAVLSFMNLLPGIGLGAAIVLVLALIRHVAGSQKRRQREARREDLLALGHSHDLTHYPERVPKQLKECASKLGGRGRRLGLEDVFSGRDDEGTYYLCTRRLEGRTHQCLLFEHKLLTLDNLLIVPHKPAVTGKLRRLWHRIRKIPSKPMRLRQTWSADPASVDERSVLMAQEIFLQMAEIRQLVEPLGLHLRIDQQRVAIYNRRPVDGEALKIFLDGALELRGRVCEAPRRSGALRLSPGDSRGVRNLSEVAGPSSETGPVTRLIRPVSAAPEENPSGPSLPYGALSTDDQLVRFKDLSKRLVKKR